jgi:hypothetical protein
MVFQSTPLADPLPRRICLRDRYFFKREKHEEGVGQRLSHGKSMEELVELKPI